MAVAAVPDPEIGVSLGKLNMLRGVELEGSTARVRIALTVPGCPMKARIAQDIATALGTVEGVDGVEVHFEAMNAEQRGALISGLRAGANSAEFPPRSPKGRR